MSRYTDKCDRCGEESDTYTSWPVCTQCGDHVCTKGCAVFWWEDEGRLRGTCEECQEILDQIGEESSEDAFFEEVTNVDFDE
jgi:hypothetical protein